LGAASVELRITLVGIVEGKQLGTDKVVTTLEAFGNLDAEVAIVVDELFGAPLAGGLVIAFVPDLEPAITGTLVVDGR